MQTTWSRPIPLRRAAWLRFGDGLVDVAEALPSALRRSWQRWQAMRLRAAEFRALRDLSPSVLRDIGIAPETIQQAQHWSDQHEVTRDTFLRGL
ncbi:MAG TPA: DUF1127 domain-containing protein [Burkholderiaceae bacterium]